MKILIFHFLCEGQVTIVLKIWKVLWITTACWLLITALFSFIKIKGKFLRLLTRIEPVYGIFVLSFRPKKQQFSVALPTA